MSTNIQPPNRIIRTVLREYFNPEKSTYTGPGVYVIRDKECLYIGKTQDISDRLKNHLFGKGIFGKYLFQNLETCQNFKIDILIPPQDTEINPDEWMKQVEIELTHRLQPRFSINYTEHKRKSRCMKGK